MDHKARPWTEEYYDAGDFFFWSPDKLGHVSATQHAKLAGAPHPGLRTYADVMEWLRRGEEPLNHILGLFFALAPTRLIGRVFEVALGERYPGPFSLLGTDAWKDLRLDGATQPDFCFRTEGALLTIEGKVRGGKSRLEQVVKYGLLAARAGEIFGARRCALVFLTPYELEGIFPQKFADWDGVRREAASHILQMQTTAFTTMDGVQRDALVDAVRTLALGSLTYKQFDVVLEACGEAAPEVESKLIAGVRQELRRRGLAG